MLLSSLFPLFPIFIFLFFLLLLLFFSPLLPLDPSYPTIHSLCPLNSPCGGDLICDPTFQRCLKPLGSDCANHNDCHSGLFCHNWSCSTTFIPPISPLSSSVPSLPLLHKSTLSVHWNDSINQIYYI